MGIWVGNGGGSEGERVIFESIQKGCLKIAHENSI